MRRTLSLVAVLCASCTERPAIPQRSTNPATSRGVDAPRSPRSIDQGLAAAVAFLAKQQSVDGLWRSDVYGTFKDGRALTPLAVVALQAADAAPEARRKGAATLAAMARPDGTIDEGPDGLDYPAYAASLSVVALSHPENAAHLKARDAWLRYLLDRQLTEKLGWKDGEKQYGGWGYCRTLPRKPAPNRIAPPLIESNLSATAYALEALRAAGCADLDVYGKAEGFVLSCRNALPRRGFDEREPTSDGGFHFIYDDPVRNKAGSDGGAPPRFHSYGSATADGARALELCGRTADGAYAWLSRHFDAKRHPGHYIAPHERNRDAVYFYYAASAAKALRRAGPGHIAAGAEKWAADLSAELIRRQRDDGSWANPIELVRENDPLVATCHATLALADCRAGTAK